MWADPERGGGRIFNDGTVFDDLSHKFKFQVLVSCLYHGVKKKKKK